MARKRPECDENGPYIYLYLGAEATFVHGHHPSTAPPHFRFAEAKIAENLRRALSDCAPHGVAVGDKLAPTERGLAIVLYGSRGGTVDAFSLASLAEGLVQSLTEDARTLAANARSDHPLAAESLVGTKKRLALLTALADCDTVKAEPTLDLADGRQVKFPVPPPADVSIVGGNWMQPRSIKGPVTGLRVHGGKTHIEIKEEFWVTVSESLETAFFHLRDHHTFIGQVSQADGDGLVHTFGVIQLGLSLGNSDCAASDEVSRPPHLPGTSKI